MRDLLNKGMEVLVWITTAFFVFNSCFAGAMIIRYSDDLGWTPMNGFLMGFFTIIFGVTVSFLFAAVCFQIMDIRNFTKHAALSLRNR